MGGARQGCHAKGVGLKEDSSQTVMKQLNSTTCLCEYEALDPPRTYFSRMEGTKSCPCNLAF